MEINHVWESPMSFAQFRKCLIRHLGKEYLWIEREDCLEFPPAEEAACLLGMLEATGCFSGVLRGYQRHCLVDLPFTLAIGRAFQGVLYYGDLLALLNITGMCLDQRRSPEAKRHFLLAHLWVVREELEVLALKQQILEVKKQQLQCLPDTQPVAVFMLRHELEVQQEKSISRTAVQSFLQEMLGWLTEGQR